MKKRFLIPILVLICILSVVFLTGAAYESSVAFDNFNGMEITKLEGEKIQNVLETCKFKYLTFVPKEAWRIVSFAVDDGRIAVAFEDVDSENNYGLICVYDDDFNLMYAYTFHRTGMYGVDWMFGSPVIVDYRSHIAVMLPDNKAINSMYVIESEKFEDYFEHSVLANKHQLDGDKYMLEYDTSGRLCTQKLVCEGKNGAKRVLYSVDYKKEPVFVYVLICIVALALIVAKFVIDDKGFFRKTAHFTFS